MKGNLASLIIGIGMLSTGCSVTNVERLSPVPDFFIEFEEGESKLNNKYLIKDITKSLTNELDDGLTAKWVVVASSNSESEYSLSVSRMNSFANAIDSRNVRVVVQPLERDEQANLFAVYHATEWDDKTKAELLGNEFSKVDSNGAYRSSDKRLYYAMPTKIKMSLKGKGVISQFDSALEQLGWSLDAHKANWSYENLFSIPTIDVVLLNENATEYEITLLVKTFMNNVLSEHEYEVDFETKTVRLWQSLTKDKDEV